MTPLLGYWIGLVSVTGEQVYLRAESIVLIRESEFNQCTEIEYAVGQERAAMCVRNKPNDVLKSIFQGRVEIHNHPPGTMCEDGCRL